MTDVRFKRIAVSILDTYPLSWYFNRRDRMEFATAYYEIEDEWNKVNPVNIVTLSDFMEQMYNTKANVLVTLFSYIINDLPKYYVRIFDVRTGGLRPIEEYRNNLVEQMSWFFRELETIGIVWDGNNFNFTVGTPELDMQINSKLQMMLSNLGNAYLARYNGAIESLMSNNPDNLSQSISSIRELLTGILDISTDGEIFTGDELTEKGEPTRRARIKRILSRTRGLGRETELADAISNMLDKTYNALSKGFHVTEKKDWENILYIFKSTEYLIYFILLQFIKSH